MAPPLTEIPNAIRRLLAVIAQSPSDLDTQLSLASLQVIQLVDAIEMAFDVFIEADDVTRANFATPRALATLLASNGVALD